MLTQFEPGLVDWCLGLVVMDWIGLKLVRIEYREDRRLGWLYMLVFPIFVEFLYLFLRAVISRHDWDIPCSSVCILLSITTSDR